MPVFPILATKSADCEPLDAAGRHDGRTAGGRGAAVFAVTAAVARGTGLCRRLMKNIEAHVDKNVRSSTAML